jgi:hypothetical protein
MDPLRHSSASGSRTGPFSASRTMASGPPQDKDPASTRAVEPATESAATREKVADVPRWLRRLSLVVFVLCCLEIGLLLVVLPWLPFWTENSLLVGSPRLQAFAQQNFVRGLISGLGLLDIWMGVWEALHYRERTR